MGKKHRTKQSDKSQASKLKRHFLKTAADLFKLCIYSPTQQEEWDYYIKLYNAVEDFQKKLKSVCSDHHICNRAEFLPAFETWLQENGVRPSSVEIKDYGDDQGFGITATNEIKVNEIIVSIPRAVMLTYEDAKKSYLKKLIESNEMLTLMPNVCLALYLHCEKYNPTSKYKPYIDVLPREFNTTLYFTPEEMKYLKGSSSQSSAINQYRSIARQFALLYQVLNGTHEDVRDINALARESFTFDAYRWCVSAVSTRQNQIPKALRDDPGGSEQTTLSLIPLWDMFNHDTGPMSTAYDTELHQLECLAMRDFKQGEQVKICYGARDNSDLLVHNGFVVPHNPFDKVKIRLGVSSQDALYGKKKQLLNRLSYEASGKFAICSLKGNLPTSPDLVAFLRVFHMSEGELDGWLSKRPDDLSSIKEVYVPGAGPFSNDSKMWWFLENRVNLLLVGCEKALDGDLNEMLNDETLSHRAKLALLLRKEEKRILEACLAFCRQLRFSALKEISVDELSPSEDIVKSVLKIDEGLKETSLCEDAGENEVSVQFEKAPEEV